MVDQHALVCAVKDLALELGRTPTRIEFAKKYGRPALIAQLGGYTILLQMAGLAPNKKKLDNSIFEKSVEQQIESYQPRKTIPHEPWPNLAIISDIHWPFSSKRVIDKFLDFIEKTQPESIFINGDAWDMYSHGKFPRSHNVFTPREEQALARKMNEEFWIEVKKRCTNAKRVQLMGNHDIRPLKRVLEEYPEAEDWIAEKLKQLFTYDGVQTVMDHRQEYIIGDIAIFHGYRSQIGAHRDFTLLNTINGHTHRGGAVFRQIRWQVLWELNTGFAGDPEAKGLTYTAQRMTDWTPGFGSVDEFGPRFIPA